MIFTNLSVAFKIINIVSFIFIKYNKAHARLYQKVFHFIIVLTKREKYLIVRYNMNLS